jgi:c-di-GMP-binding flagellar brake protein YcgR
MSRHHGLVSTNRRKNYRVDVTGDAQFRLEVVHSGTRQKVTAVMVDLSYGGIGFTVPATYFLAVGDKLQVTLRSEDASIGPLDARIRTARLEDDVLRLGTAIRWTTQAMRQLTDAEGASELLNRRGAFRVAPRMGQAPTIAVHVGKGEKPHACKLRDISIDGLSVWIKADLAEQFKAERRYGLVAELPSVGSFRVVGSCCHSSDTKRRHFVGFQFKRRGTKGDRKREDLIMGYVMRIKS